MHQQRMKLLLVDGDVARAERLARRLSGPEWDIQFADNGASALLKAHAARPDVVVSTSELPVLNGFLMLQALRSEAQTCHLPVILLTEGSSHEELARGWKSGADLCIPRGQGDVDVVGTLHRALSGLIRRDSHLEAPVLA